MRLTLNKGDSYKKTHRITGIPIKNQSNWENQNSLERERERERERELPWRSEKRETNFEEELREEIENPSWVLVKREREKVERERNI